MAAEAYIQPHIPGHPTDQNMMYVDIVPPPLDGPGLAAVLPDQRLGGVELYSVARALVGAQIPNGIRLSVVFEGPVQQDLRGQKAFATAIGTEIIKLTGTPREMRQAQVYTGLTPD